MEATCGKCDGRGHIDGFEHVEKGVCFACGGTGRVSVRAAKQNAAQAHKSARVAALAAADAALEAEWARLNISDPARFDAAKAALFGAPSDAEAVAAVREIVR